MQWIYLSPHFDDAALSCGGLAWEQAQAGQSVSIWTICAGAPEESFHTPFIETLHTRWGMEAGAVPHRMGEDARSCQEMGASYRHFHIPDCIYRGSSEPLYASEESLFGSLHPAEQGLIDLLSAELSRSLSEKAAGVPQEVEIVCPLALGKHVDHQLTRDAAERLDRPLWYYADYPYVLKEQEELARLQQDGWEAVKFTISSAGLHAWEAAVSAHASQISTFWTGLDEMRAALRAYCRSRAGLELWRKAK